MPDQSTLPRYPISINFYPPKGLNRSFGKSKNVFWTFAEIKERIGKPLVSPETLEQFLALPKGGEEGQDALKAAAGYFQGAQFADQAEKNRKTGLLLGRRLAVMDHEGGTRAEAEAVLRSPFLRGKQWFFYTTRKHHPDSPRFRTGVFFNRDTNGDEAILALRLVGEKLSPGLRGIDPISFKRNQIMFWPTRCSDSVFRSRGFEGEEVDLDALIAEFEANGGDRNNTATWPRARHEEDIRLAQAKAENPLSKRGIIGAFCRAYPIPELIEEFFADRYVPGDDVGGEVRYSAVGSTTSNGLVLYDGGQFAYSFHSSDALAQKMVNAFDFARIVKFGHLDKAGHRYEDVRDAPSYLACRDWARTLPLVQEEEAEVVRDLDDSFESEDEPAGPHAALDGPSRPAEVVAVGETGEEELERLGAIADARKAITPGLAGARALRERVEAKGGKVEPIIHEMNCRFALVRTGGKTVTAEFLKSGEVALGSAEGLMVYFANKVVEKRVGKGVQNLGAYWLEHPHRRSYPGGIVFDPSAKADHRTLNLWTGMAVSPSAPSGCERILEVLRENICAGDEDTFRYVRGWLAHAVQRPWEKPDVALVIRGVKGIGKDIIGWVMRLIFGRHGIHIDKPDQLTNNFNSRFAQAVFVHVEEAYWAGDQSKKGVLQSLITSPTQVIENKGINAVDVTSHLRVYMTTNDGWAVPATEGERRYAVFDAKANWKGDFEFWREVVHEARTTGPGALLSVLMAVDLTGFEPRDVPQTKALLDQKEASLRGAQRYLGELLRRGDEEDGWRESVSCRDFKNSYDAWRRGAGPSAPALTETLISREVRVVFPMMPKPERLVVGGERLRYFLFPSLDEARKAYEKWIGHDVSWD